MFVHPDIHGAVLHDAPALIASLTVFVMAPLARPFVRWPAAVATLIAIIVLGTFTMGAIVGDSGPFWMAIWFLAVPFAFKSLTMLLEGQTFKTYQLEIHLPLVVGVALFYSSTIYPRMKPQFGGGRPTHVIVWFSDKNALGFERGRVEASLIDETEHGYYLKPTDSETAYFVPRSAVTTVHFVLD